MGRMKLKKRRIRRYREKIEWVNGKKEDEENRKYRAKTVWENEKNGAEEQKET